MKMKLTDAIADFRSHLNYNVIILSQILRCLAGMRRVSVPEIYRAIAMFIRALVSAESPDASKWNAIAAGLEQRAEQMPELEQVALPIGGDFKFYGWKVDHVFHELLNIFNYMLQIQRTDIDGGKGNVTTGEMVKIIKLLLRHFAAADSTRGYIKKAGIYEILGDAVKDLQTIQDALGESDFDQMHEDTSDGGPNPFSWSR